MNDKAEICLQAGKNMAEQQTRRGEALIAILNNWSDWLLLEKELWYRVPVEKAPRRWPPQWLAFYQTKIFGDEAYTIRWYGKVRSIRRVQRRDLFPNELPNTKSERLYYQIFLNQLELLPHPIISRRLRRIVFISTTYHKLMTANEINDLYDDSPLEDTLWNEFKQLHLMAERQYDVTAGGKYYFLDFALFCAQGKVDIETDGDRWHADPARIPEDNRRNNDLTAKGWRVVRFNTSQIREEMAPYCVPLITQTVNELGGAEAEDAPRTYYSTGDGIVQQLALFDNSATYAEIEPPHDT